jgi:hypothetical protein
MRGARNSSRKFRIRSVYLGIVTTVNRGILRRRRGLTGATGGGEKATPWLALATSLSTAIVSVISAVVVTWMTQQTNLRLAEFEKSARAAAADIEIGKLREQQEARRQQFLEKHLGDLLSPNDVTRRVARALLFASYASEASDIIAQVVPATSGSLQESLVELQREAQIVRAQTGNWVVVISGDKTFVLARKWASAASSAGFTPVIYLRDSFYRVTVGSYPTRQQADQAALAIRPLTRPDAYVVALGQWCPQATTKTESGFEITSCRKPAE